MKISKKRYGLKQSRKAQHPATMVFFYAACFLMAGFVAYTFIKIAYYGARDQSFKMQYFANDIGVVMDTLYAVPGDAVYEYRKNPNDFIVDFRNISIWAYTPIKLIQNKAAAYWYMANPEKPFSMKFSYPVALYFKKTGVYVEASENGIFEKVFGCPPIQTTGNMQEKFIIIDPGHYDGDPGYINETREEYKITKQIAESMRVLCQTRGIKCYILKQASMNDKLDEISMLQKPDMIISIHIGDSPKAEDNPLAPTVPIDSDLSEKLSCLIKSAFGKMLFKPLDNKRIDPGSVRPTDYEALLKKDIPSVMLEIGNIKNPIAFKDNKVINDAANAIISAIEEYYKPIKEPTPTAVAPKPETPPSAPAQPAQPKTTTKDQGKVRVINSK